MSGNPSHQHERVQRQFSYDDGDFLYGRLLCRKFCVVKRKRTNRWIFNLQNNKSAVSCSVRSFSIVVLMFFLCFLLFRMEIGNFRIGTLRVLLSHILNLTTSDTRQHGQSYPFTASSSQRVRGMRNCRASIVAETEKPFLMEHQRLYSLLFAS